MNVPERIEQCNTCRYWQRVKLNEGFCRYNPPQVQSVVVAPGQVATNYFFPATRGDIWCGKYENGTPKDSMQ